MGDSRVRTWQSRSWQSRPSLDRSGTRPVGARLPLLALVLAGALAIHAAQQANHRSPAEVHSEVHGDIVGKAWVIDGDTIDISGSRARLNGNDAPESNQTCADVANKAWLCGRAATHQLIDTIAGQPIKS